MPIPVPLPIWQFCAEELYIADLMMIELNVPTARIQPVYRVVVVLTVDVKIVMLSDFNQGVAAIVADEGSPVVSHDYNYPITVRANSLIATSDNVLALHCGCTAGDINKFCDKTFDGIFEGKCNADGDCKPPLAAVQQRPLSS